MRTASEVRRWLATHHTPRFSPEYRGRSTRLGRPDTIMWIKLDWLNTVVFPILIEEEYKSGFNSAIEDFRLFAGRQHRENNCIRFPVINNSFAEKTHKEPIVYDIQAVSGTMIGTEAPVGEDDVHRFVSNWVNTHTQSMVKSNVYIHNEAVVRIVYDINIFGEKIQITYPVFTDEATTTTVREELTQVRVPALAVVPSREQEKKRPERFTTRIELLDRYPNTLSG